MMDEIEMLSLKATDLLKSLIKIPSTSRQENEAADHLQAYMEECGLETGRIANNLWSLSPVFDLARPTILLNAHIDTVKPASSWTLDPFTPTVKGGKLYGLGSNDDGASLVCLLHTFMTLCKTNQAYNMIFLASAEEEVSGKQGIELAQKYLPPFSLALVGEPTGMQPAVAEKGLMVLDIIAKGKSGHAARNEGVNAIYEALDDFLWIRDHHFQKVSDLLGEVKMTLTVVNSGTQHNVIPDLCTGLIDVRSNECYTNEELFKEIQDHLRSEVKAHSFRLGSSSISMDHPIVRKALAMGKQPFGSPTLSDQALLRCPSMKMGPGNSSRSHTADEFIMLDEITDGIKGYLEMLDGLKF